MSRFLSTVAISLVGFSAAFAAVINTNSAADVAAFQSGATVNTFESVTGVTPLSITSYTSGLAVPEAATVFDQITGVQFSVGGTPGTNKPAIYKLGGGIAGDAKSATNVMGGVDFDGNSLFGPGALIEIFFPVKVARVGFWLNPALGNVLIIAADTNFAFSKLTETTLETSTVTAGNFVGISRTTADIGGFKIIGLGATGFTIDDFTFGGVADTGSTGGGSTGGGTTGGGTTGGGTTGGTTGGGTTGGDTTTVPEPSALILSAIGMAAVAAIRRTRRGA